MGIFSAKNVVLLYGSLFDLTHAQTRCLKQWCVGAAACNYNSLIATLTTQLSASGCTNSALTELKLVFGVSTSEEVKHAIAKVCTQSYEKFEEITGRGKIFDKEFFDGGTYWNEEREWITSSGIVKERLAVDPGAQIDQFYNGIAQSEGVTWPDKMDNFKDCCKLGAAMCCWVQDRQAGDNNGNCATPYDINCHDADPAGKSTSMFTYLYSCKSSDLIHLSFNKIMLTFATLICSAHQHQAVRHRALFSLIKTLRAILIVTDLHGADWILPMNLLNSRQTTYFT